jgi:hypothetical protein
MDATDVRRVLLAGLIDHAALFPPASMGMDRALEEDAAARDSPHAWTIGRFVCPASRLGELHAALAAGWADSPELSVVLDGAGGADADAWAAAVRSDAAAVADAAAGGARVGSVEVRLPGPRPESPALVAAYSALRELGVEAFLELVPGARWRDTLPAAVGAAAAVGAGAKLRCGGAGEADFPPVELVALALLSCSHAGVRLKATAGLHHPVRHREAATGFHQHGFLNLLAAAGAAADGAAAPELERILAEEDAGAFRLGAAGLALAGLELRAEGAARARALFTSYGSCSWREPLDDLERLGALS